MKSGSKKICFGLLIASLHIDVFGVVLFPACFGFAILYLGIYTLEKEGLVFPLSERQLKYYHMTAAALVLVSGMIGFTSILGILPNWEVWNLLPCVLEYVVCFGLMEAYVLQKPSYAGLKRGYAIVMGVTLIGYWLSLFLNLGIWQLFCAVVILICRAMVLFAALSDKKDENSEPLQEKVL